MNFKLVVTVLASSVLLVGCTHEEDVIAPTQTPSPTVTSTPTESPTTTPSPTVPVDWEVSTSETLQVSMAHPPDWFVSQAGSSTGEFAVTSFNPDTTPDKGGVPQSEIKVAIIRITADDQRSTAEVIDQDQVVSTEEVTVDGNSATLYEIAGGLGGSLTTEVQTEQGVYFISAYPPDSELIDTYRQILSTVSFE